MMQNIVSVWLLELNKQSFILCGYRHNIYSVKLLLVLNFLNVSVLLLKYFWNVLIFTPQNSIKIYLLQVCISLMTSSIKVSCMYFE